jgi:uncharacterized membrane protein (DUF373 family)
MNKENVFEKIIKSDKIIVVIISSILFYIGMLFGISVVMIKAMSFLIILEITRTIYEYIVNPNHRIKLRFIIDGAILFGIRELFVGWIMLKTDLMLGGIITGVSLFIIGILIWYRKRVVESSPDNIEGEKNET